MNETERQDRIDKYVRGEMTPEEQASFLQELAADDSLAHDVQFTQDISRSLGAWEEKKRLMAQWEEEAKGEQNNKEGLKVVGGQSAWRMFSTVAALAACLLVGFFFFWNKTDEPTGAIRGSASVEQINDMIDDGKYEEAIMLIDEVLADTMIDQSLPEDEQEYLREKQVYERDTLGKLREKALEKSRKP